MRKPFVLWLLLLLAWIIFGVFIWQKYLCDCWGARGKTTSSQGLSNWNIADSTTFSVVSNDFFKFARSKPTHAQPVSTSLQRGVSETIAYLNAHPDRALTITGYYSDEEKNTSLLPNLGLGRANEVKSYLTSMGLHANHLLLESKLIPNAKWFSKDTLLRGIDFSFSKVKTTDDRLIDIKNRLLNKPITLYFGLNQNIIELDEKQRSDFADLLYYLDNVEGSNLNIGGHTDNLGLPGTNNKLSQERADFVSKYLSENANIAVSKITATGFGSSKPIVPNTTKENKARNRRVEIILN
jgi:OmpA-OmpF porin, OOP family